MKTIIDRLKSPVVLMSIACQIAIIIAIFNPSLSDTFKATVMPVIEILTLVGILNNPTDKEGF